MKKFLILFISIFFFTNVYGDNLEIFQFDDKELDSLKVRKIRGAKNLTSYSLDNNDKGNFLRAEVEDGGSGLGKEVLVDLNKTPFLNITWKVEKDLSGINEKSKKGHDYAARFFVVKKTGLTPLSNKAINYVFSSNEEIGEFWTSPYTKSSIDYVLSSTKNSLNKWVTVKTNVKEDYKKLHNLDIDILDGVAIMADTDQSKKRSISYFQSIYFSAN
tara:strand:- start:985 stop:1632 length:648 start_codon:yes stop_codon:yes gene_type:complete